MSDTLDYRTVRHVDLTALQAVVKAWNKLPEDFREVHTSFDRTVTKPMSTERSGWHGDSQKAAVKHFTVVQNQVTEAAGQTEWLGKEMSRCLKVFESAKKDLTEVESTIAEKPESGGDSFLRLDSKDGRVHVDLPDDADRKDVKKAEESRANLNEKIEKALRDATEADTDLKKALTYDPRGDGFNRDSPEMQAKKDVDALYKLAGDEDFKRDPKLISKANGIFAMNAGNADFAEEFATRKGAKGVLQFWYKAAQPDYEDALPPDPMDRPKGVDKQLAALQDNLGSTLALASHSDSPAMGKWKQDVIDLGYQRMGRQAPDVSMGTSLAPPPYGFQVMSNLMRTGKWDTRFLHDYGEALLKTDKKAFIPPVGVDNREEQIGARKWGNYGINPPNYLNFGPAYDQGKDPFTGYLEALGHNAEASTAFFNDDDTFEYLTRKRHWAADGPPPEGGSDNGATGPRVALGHALASATTGHDWDAPLPHPPSHTEDQARIMTELIKGIAEKDGIELAPGMHEGLGRAAGEYTPDLFRALKDGSDDDLLFPVQGTPIDADEVTHTAATRFLAKLGQDPDAHGKLMFAQKMYMGEVLEHHLTGDLPAGQRYDASPKETVQEILRASGEVAGTLAIGRQEAVVGTAVVRDAQFESATLSARLWGTTGFATGVIPATVKWMSPVAGAAVGTIVTGAAGAGAYDIDAQISRSESIDKADIASRMYERAQKEDIKRNEDALDKLEQYYGVDTSDSWSEVFSKQGFDEAVTRVNRTAPFLDSMDQVKSLPVERSD
ncbi:hypothetical protein AB0939_18870 [Streptomyces sp. NPDC006990]|uniref:hypothetical protein n=1 Tax=Streptomyces sp. NPDC006990 TaxID=3154481 RepID=UPI003455FE3F